MKANKTIINGIGLVIGTVLAVGCAPKFISGLKDSTEPKEKKSKKEDKKDTE